MMEQEFQRIQRLPPYVFERVNKLKAESRAAGKDIIDFGINDRIYSTRRAMYSMIGQIY